MPVYLLHGFRWPREGFTGIRVHAIVNNLEDCSVEYIQNENSQRDILDSFRKGFPESMQKIETSGLKLEFVEQHDPTDLHGPHAVSQPYAFVADKVVEMAGRNDGASTTLLSLNVEDVIAAGSELLSQSGDALADLRDKIAGGEKIGWWVVYNGDPERAYVSSEDEDTDEDEDDDTDDDDNASTPTQTTTEDILVREQQEKQASSSSSTSASSTPSVTTLPTRPKVPSKPPVPQKDLPKIPVPDTAQMPDPKDEKVPEPTKLKEVAQKTGFRKKFFGKKA